jgi:hypothetical protein
MSALLRQTSRSLDPRGNRVRQRSFAASRSSFAGEELRTDAGAVATVLPAGSAGIDARARAFDTAVDGVQEHAARARRAVAEFGLGSLEARVAAWPARRRRRGQCVGHSEEHAGEREQQRCDLHELTCPA